MWVEEGRNAGFRELVSMFPAQQWHGTGAASNAVLMECTPGGDAPAQRAGRPGTAAVAQACEF